jgi:DNA-directed RNA polymerase specialized sigma24 family protein
MHGLCRALPEDLDLSAGASAGARPDRFRSLVFAHSERICSVVTAILGSRALAEKVGIEAFAGGHGRIEACAEPLLEVLRLAVAECRHWRVRAALARLCRPFAAHGEARSFALSLLSRLPWRERVPLALREVGGLSPRQIAYVLGRAETDIRADLVIARQNLLKSTRNHR